MDFKKGDYVRSLLEDFHYWSVWIVDYSWPDTTRCVRPFYIANDKKKIITSSLASQYKDGIIFPNKALELYPIEEIVQLKLAGVTLPK